jgi:hypothetical protein
MTPWAFHCKSFNFVSSVVQFLETVSAAPITKVTGHEDRYTRVHWSFAKIIPVTHSNKSEMNNQVKKSPILDTFAFQPVMGKDNVKKNHK